MQSASLLRTQGAAPVFFTTATGTGAGTAASAVGSIRDGNSNSIRECVRKAINAAASDDYNNNEDGCASGSSSVCYGSVNSNIGSIVSSMKEPDAVVVVFGTAFIMAEARAELGVVEPKDGDLLESDNTTDRDAQVECFFSSVLFL